MGHPVVHFEVIGQDGQKLRSYYSDCSSGTSTTATR